MADQNSLLPTDLVLVKMTLRARGSISEVSLKKTVSVEELGIQVAEKGAAPVFDTAKFAEVIQHSPDEAIAMHAEFAAQTAEYLAQGGETHSETLATAVVDWVIETKPDGHVCSRDDSSEAYVINENAINIAGPHVVGDDRMWRVSAVGTWG